MHPTVSIWTIAPLSAYSKAQLDLALRIHSALDRGSLVLAPPR